MCASLWVLLLAGTGLSGLAEPYRPDSDATILARLPRLTGTGTVLPYAPPQALPVEPASGSTTADPAMAIETARRLVSEARKEADPRLLSRARVQLHPWWRSTNAPTDIVLLRAEIRQGLHDFTAALADVDLALRQNPRHPGAWLLKATLHQVRGEYGAAGQACLQLSRFGDELTAITATASLRSLGDPTGAAASALEQCLARHPDAPTATRAWSLTTLGEIQSRLGKNQEAEAAFRRSLELEPGQPYTLSVLSDLLLSMNRPDAVIELLRDATPDALRLRLAEARRATNAATQEARQLEEELADAFELATQRGDDLHLREHARFVLNLLGNPREALRLAQRNWTIQKEPADLRLLIATARVAGDSQVARETEEWASLHQPGISIAGDSRF